MSVASLTGQFVGATVIGTLPSFGLNPVQGWIEALANPALAFVPIYCDSVEMHREAAISTSMIMSQALGNKQFVTDNTAPHPRVWTMHGYLRSLLPFLEGTLFMKPTIILQQQVLDYAMLSRKAINYKTTESEIVDVLIRDIKITKNPKNQSAAEVSIVVQELNYLIAIDGVLGELGKAANFSLNMTALTSIGIATVIAAAASVIPLASGVVGAFV